MSIKERAVEEKIIGLFRSLGYEYSLGRELRERANLKEVILRDRLGRALRRLNPGFSENEIALAVKTFLRDAGDYRADALLSHNRDIYNKLVGGISIKKEDGDFRLVRFFDFENSENNDFLVVNQFSVEGFGGEKGQRRVPDIVVFVNGIPLAVIELKNPAARDATLRSAYKQLAVKYTKDIPRLFVCNQLLVVSDNTESKVGVLGGQYEYFNEWKRTRSENEDNRSADALNIFIEGIFDKARFLDIIENFILFSVGDKVEKKMCRYHQYYGVREVFEKIIRRIAISARTDSDKKLGVYWHTQGSGKTLSVLFLWRKLFKKRGTSLFVYSRQGGFGRPGGSNIQAIRGRQSCSFYK